MKKLLLLSVLVASLFVVLPSVSAQGMMGNFNNQNGATPDPSTAQDEANGKAVWDKLQAKQVTCKDLTDDDFDVLGDYFMGQMVGSSHSTMNSNMTRMMGADGEKQMHIVMGKQYSGCNSINGTPATPSGTGYFPMMGGWGQQGFGNRGFMMGGTATGFYGVHMILALVTWVIGIVFLLLGIVYFWKGITRKEKR